MILGATMATKRVSQMSWKQLARCESFSEAEAKELKVRVARETMENAAALAQQRTEEEALREETALWEARLRELEECERLLGLLLAGVVVALSWAPWMVLG